MTPQTTSSLLAVALGRILGFFNRANRALSRKLDPLTLPRRVPPVVTVLGSCRQDSLKKHFRFTSIRDGLTYPHYANEVLQLIKFLKGEIKEFSSPFVFRNDSIGVRKISRRAAQRAFRSTDVFVIEIASRLEYIHEGNFIHHVAFDEPGLLPLKLNQKSLTGNIERRKQTFDELRATLDAISDELRGKSVVLVSNISTSIGSERHELNSYLSAYAASRGFGFFDPSTLLEEYSIEQICRIEPVISHFTDQGHELVGRRLRTIVLEQYEKQMSHALGLTQKYMTNSDSSNVHGLGDFLYGALTVFESAHKFGLIPRVDISEHPIMNYLNTTTRPQEGVRRIVFHEDSSRPLAFPGVVFTNKRPQITPSLPAVDWMRTEVMVPNQALKDEIENAMRALDIREKNYFSIHVRLDDSNFEESAESAAKILDIVTMILKIKSGLGMNADVVLFSNSSQLKDICRTKGLKTSNSNPVHLGTEGSEVRNILETLVEFFLISKSRHIVQISAYGWGSGFSELAALMGETAITKIRI